MIVQVETEFDKSEFIKVFEGLVMSRFQTIEEINKLIQDKLGFNPNLEKKVLDSEMHEDWEHELDNSLISNCTVDGEDLCFLDIYYLIDNANRMYITEVGYDFAT